MARKVIIIGSGFSGLSAACFLQKKGWQVTVIEKNEQPGGRARQFFFKGFKFDMGPSWYWMPDVFERFFGQFGKSVRDYYELVRLDPSYRIYWEDDYWDIPADYNQLKKRFEQIEKGSSLALDKFIEEAAYKYSVGINKLVFKPGLHITEFLDWEVIKGISRLDIFTSHSRHVNRYFQNPKIRQMLEFPVLFLGALAQKIPALYSLMNYADIKLGTWYPKGGMFKIVEAMYLLAKELGVEFVFNCEARKIITKNRTAKCVACINEKEFPADVVLGSADYHFIENNLLDYPERSYSAKYWDSRLMAPSCLLYYVGLNKKLRSSTHHSLFFDVPFDKHAQEIYTGKTWPEEPLFYVGCPSVTDETVAPPGCENLFFLVPVAAGSEDDSNESREHYFQKIVARFEARTGESLADAIIYKRSFSISDFKSEYNSFKGNAYGLANTLMQTAIFKPACRSKKIKNLFYAGQLTVPGPGVPPCLISGEVVANQILKHFG